MCTARPGLSARGVGRSPGGCLHRIAGRTRSAPGVSGGKVVSLACQIAVGRSRSLQAERMRPAGGRINSGRIVALVTPYGVCGGASRKQSRRSRLSNASSHTRRLAPLQRSPALRGFQKVRQNSLYRGSWLLLTACRTGADLRPQEQDARERRGFRRWNEPWADKRMAGPRDGERS